MNKVFKEDLIANLTTAIVGIDKFLGTSGSITDLNDVNQLLIENCLAIRVELINYREVLEARASD